MVKFNFVAALAAGFFTPSAKAYPKDKEFEFRPPGSDGVRSPCPALNTLANHGYINRNGTDIEIKDLMQAGEDVFSLSRGFIKALVDGNIRTGMVFEGAKNAVDGALLFDANGDEISCKMDLDALFNHNIGADHDVSLFRPDENVEEDALFDQSRFSKFLQTLDPDATEATLEQIVDFQIEDILDGCATNAHFLETANDNFINAAAGEKIAFFVLQSSAPDATEIMTLGAELTVDLESLKTIVKNNRLPQDFESLKDRALREEVPFEPLGTIDTLVSDTFKYVAGRMCGLNNNGDLDNCLDEEGGFTRSVTIPGETFGLVTGCGCDDLIPVELPDNDFNVFTLIPLSFITGDSCE